ncbi:hypothetical protein GGR52DRAFT_580071 [Hypoxylon sp. FL1284]|nr:hypothetical protein GGR52DRAFT_580071 [Hypoxylon sp. FL1284]
MCLWLPTPTTAEDRLRQRRISRKKNGVRVSRRLSPRDTGISAGVGSNRQYSLMRVSEFTEDHPYWGTLRQSRIHDARPDDHGHVRTAGRRKPPTQKLERVGQKPSGRRRKGMSIAGRNPVRAREKRFGVADPVVWDAINRSLVQQRQLSSLIVPGATSTQAIPDLEVPSRTSSQHKALNRFTRQLEKYANVTRAASNVPVPLITPTESDSKVSYHTVKPLLPYQKEFGDAGLAVTSVEQSRRSPVRLKGDQAREDRPSESSKEPMEANGDLDGQEDPTSEQLSSSSGSFIEFTPDISLVEPLPSSKAKSKQKSTYKQKRGILPWLKKNPTVGETHLTKDGQVQNKTKAIDSQRSRAHHPSNANNPTTSCTRPQKLPSAPTITSPQKPPYVESEPNKGKQGGRGRHSEPIIPHTNLKPEAGQPVVHTGLRKRDVAVARLPRPETIEEEQEASPSRIHQTTTHENPRPESKVVPNQVTETKQVAQTVSSHTSPSTIPSLPYPARYASGRPSSLERALEEVSQQLDNMELEADKTAMHSRPPTLVEKTNQQEQKRSPSRSVHRISKNTLPRQPHMSEEFIYVDRRMPPVSPREQKPKPKPVPAQPESPSRPRSKPARATGARRRSQPLPSPPKEKTLPKTPQAKDVTSDEDAPFDYDDAEINDRDVIRGLQVAIHAAADNKYDALIRDKTGLRIRRFLADLRAVGEMPPEKSDR